MSMKVWDVACSACGKVEYDVLFSSWESTVSACGSCGGSRHKLVGTRQRSGGWHASSRIVVYRGPDGDIKYPGRNDLPMPSRYRQQGYERVEMSDLATASRFEKQTGTVCEALHWDSNGKTFSQPDTEGVYAPKVEYSNLLND